MPQFVFRDLEMELAYEVIDWAEGFDYPWEDGGMVWGDDDTPMIPVGLTQDVWDRWDGKP